MKRPLLTTMLALSAGLLKAQEPELRPSLVGAHSSRAISLLVPEKGRHKHLFDRYDAAGGAAWARSWTRRVDLTGVAWDLPQAGVLVTPEHILIARHMGRDITRPIVFHDARGRRVERKIVGGLVAGQESREQPFPPNGPDVMVMRLDQPVPEGVRVYRLLPPMDEWRRHLGGATALYTDQERKLMVTRVLGVAGGIVRFTRHPDIDPFYQEKVIAGDSAKPSFLLVNGEPVLIETKTTGGWGSGPFLSDPDVFRLTDEAVVRLGGRYQLATIPLKGIPARGNRK